MFNIKTTTNLDTILKGFNKTLDELNSFIEDKCDETTNLKIQVMDIGVTIKENTKDIDKANTVLNNIRKIIGE